MTSDEKVPPSRVMIESCGSSIDGEEAISKPTKSTIESTKSTIESTKSTIESTKNVINVVDLNVEVVKSVVSDNKSMNLRTTRTGYWETLPVGEKRDDDILTYVPRTLHSALEYVVDMKLGQSELEFFHKNYGHSLIPYPDLEEFRWSTGDLVLGVRGKLGLVGMVGARPYIVRIDGEEITMLMYNNFVIAPSMRHLGIAQCMMDKMFMMGHEKYGTKTAIYARTGDDNAPGKICTLTARHVVVDSIACTLAGLHIIPGSVFPADKFQCDDVVDLTPDDVIERIQRLYKQKQVLHIPSKEELTSGSVVCIGSGDDFLVANITTHMCKTAYKVGIIQYLYGDERKLAAALVKKVGVIKIEFLIDILDRWASGKVPVNVHVVNMKYKKKHKSDVQLML